MIRSNIVELRASKERVQSPLAPDVLSNDLWMLVEDLARHSFNMLGDEARSFRHDDAFCVSGLSVASGDRVTTARGSSYD
jgi:hypothetical protein